MKCTQCGQEIHDEQGQAHGDLLSPLGLGTGESQRSMGPPGVDKRNGTNRRSRISADWQPTQAQRTYCEQQGKDPQVFAQVFTEYYLAKGTQWLNWDKVWQKACREWQGHVAAKPEAPKETLQERNLSQWRQRLAMKSWSLMWGPPPGEPGCMVPKELLP